MAPLRGTVTWFIFVTLCAYAQLVMHMHMVMCLVASVCVSPVSVIYCSLVEFNSQKRGLQCQAIRSGKEIWNHSINGTEKGSWKIVLWQATPCLNAMQLCMSYAMLTNATYVQLQLIC